MHFTIEVFGQLYANQTLATIYARRDNPSLFIFYNEQKLTYQAFRHLASVRKPLLRLESGDNTEIPERLPEELQRPFDKSIKITHIPEASPQSPMDVSVPPPSNGAASSSQVPIKSTIITPPTINLNSAGSYNNVNMDCFAYLKNSGSLIPYFDSKIGSLKSFINAIRLVESITPPDMTPQFVQLIKSKLRGKSADLCEHFSTVDDIIFTLKDEITHEPSAVLESKLDALVFDYKNLNEFCTLAEDLAEQLITSLENEGVIRRKATEMVISKLTILCRQSARNPEIKSVLGGSSFTQPRDVLSKFRTEIALLSRETQFNRRQQGNHYNNNNFAGQNFPNRRPNYNSINNNNNYNQYRSNPSNNNNNNRGQFQPRFQSNNTQGPNRQPQQQMNSNVRVVQEQENDNPARWPVNLEEENTD